MAGGPLACAEDFATGPATLVADFAEASSVINRVDIVLNVLQGLRDAVRVLRVDRTGPKEGREDVGP